MMAFGGRIAQAIAEKASARLTSCLETLQWAQGS